MSRLHDVDNNIVYYIFSSVNETVKISHLFEKFVIIWNVLTYRKYRHKLSLSEVFDKKKIQWNVGMPRDSRALPTRDAGQRAQGLSPSSRDERQQQLVATSARWSLRRDRVDILLPRVDVEVVEN